MKRPKMVALIAIFGALSLLFTQVWVPLFFGNPNLGSTPITLAAVLCPMPVGVVSGIIKGLGASLWTGQPYIEIPAGVGDALMAILTNLLSRRLKRKVYAVVAGQLSRYLFTSGMIALYIGLAVSLGSSGPEAATLQSLQKRLPMSMHLASYLPSPMANILIVWLAISPAVTLSIMGNIIVSAAVITIAGERLGELMRL
ncbi:MAG: hypothetical protein QW639_06170 [Candidatus Bathyarchaeia archaeon]